MNILMMCMMLLSCVHAHVQVVYNNQIDNLVIVIVDKNCQILRLYYWHMATLEAEVEVSRSYNRLISDLRLTVKGWTKTFFGVVIQRIDSVKKFEGWTGRV